MSIWNVPARSLLSHLQGATQTTALTYSPFSKSELLEFPEETSWNRKNLGHSSPFSNPQKFFTLSGLALPDLSSTLSGLLLKSFTYFFWGKIVKFKLNETGFIRQKIIRVVNRATTVEYLMGISST